MSLCNSFFSSVALSKSHILRELLEISHKKTKYQNLKNNVEAIKVV